jgi:hypothetical protein
MASETWDGLGFPRVASAIFSRLAGLRRGHPRTLDNRRAFGVKGDAIAMVPQDLESELKNEPFQPFRIVTTNGKTYDITEKDRPLLLVGKRTVIIGLRVPETDPYFDRYEVVSLLHIVRLEPIPQQQQTA